jgi:hypothetical protein
MESTAAGTGDRSKWEVTRDALIAAVGNMPDSTAIGLLGYPNMQITGTPGDPANCVNIGAMVSVNLLGEAGQRDAVIQGLQAIQTNRCTPTFDAYNTGLEDFAASPAAGQKYMMLMTDGQPTLLENCSPDANCSAAAAPDGESHVLNLIGSAYANRGIKTFVLGCPGSETHVETGLDNRWWLSQGAELGGTADMSTCSHSAEPYCHFDMTTGDDFEASLRAALADIVGQVVACDYAVPLPPEGETVDLANVNLVLRPGGGQAIQILRTNPPCQQGYYVDETTEQVHLCAETCSIIQTDALAEMELFFGCAPDYLPVQ